MVACEIIPSHKVAMWLLSTIDRILDAIGLSKERTVEEIVYVGLIVGMALFVGWAIRRCILALLRKIARWHNTELTQSLLNGHVLSRCSHVIPPLVIMALLPFAFDTKSTLLHIFRILLYVYTVIVFARAIIVINTFIWTRIDKHENTKNLPLKGILNVCNGFVWIVAAIIAGSIVLDKSPVALLTGLGAFATVLMLIFKDSILGFVAGIQLSQNDMLRVGDWIIVPSTIANGIVIDVSLTAVKVRNWDNTIVTLPPYTLVSTSFQNWRGMQETGRRLINKTVLVDTDSVVTADESLLAEVAGLPGMADFITKVQKSGQFYDPGVATVNGTISTNLGLLRAYMCNYLLRHPMVSNESQILVNVTTPNEFGLPLQIWCYTSPKWTAFEAVKSEIFEHLTAVAPKFRLRIYNSPSGNDITSVSLTGN